MEHLHLLYTIKDAWIVFKKKEKKIHIIPCTNEWKGKGMNIYITLSIVRELCTRIPENMRKDPLKLPEEAKKMFTERTALELRHK